MHIVYCANCGTRLNVTRRALKKYAAIIDIVEYHECPPEPVEFDLKPVDIPSVYTEPTKYKFVQKLNELSQVSSDSLRDRRSEQPEKKPVEEPTKTSAPNSVLGMIKNMNNSEPAHTLKEPESED